MSQYFQFGFYESEALGKDSGILHEPGRQESEDRNLGQLSATPVMR